MKLNFSYLAIQPGYRNITIEPHYNTTTASIVTSPAPRGCPLDYNWCYFTPIVKLFQLIIGFFLLVVGYTIANVMSFTIYSKLLGPWPQVS
jgi:ceroid-lipofuscinosis MFS transporter 7